MKFAGADWVEAQGIATSEIGRKAADILGQVYRGIYHIDRAVLRKSAVWGNPHYAKVTVAYPLATFDGDELTALVVLCHDECVRLQIRGVGPGWLELMFHQRKRVGSFPKRHPTMEVAVENLRDRQRP